jgi:putative endonuclease
MTTLETRRQTRRRAERKGHWSEWLAAAALILKGYRPLARRYRTRLGEIDLIVRKRDLVAFVEVKARKDEQSAVDAVTPTAAHRIAAAGDLWLSRRPDAAKLSVRYDIVAVIPGRWPRHFPDAF